MAPVLAPRQILDQAHHQAVLAVGLDDERGNLGLAKVLIGLQVAPGRRPDHIADHPSFWRRVTVIGRLRPISAMLSTISLNSLLLRTRGFTT